MEARIARLESHVAHIQKDLAEIKVDLKSLHARFSGPCDRVEAGFADICQSITQLRLAVEKTYGESKAEAIVTRLWALSTLGGVLLIMAREFEWI